MKNGRTPNIFFSTRVGMTRLLVVLCLVCSCSAEATAPRIAPQLFGEEKKADIVGYQFAMQDAGGRPDHNLAAEIVTEAYKAAGRAPLVDMLPSKRLAKYALLNSEAAAMIGTPLDLSAKEKPQYLVVIFYLRTNADATDQPIALIFNKKHAHVSELHRAFSTGLQKLLDSGRYLELLERRYGKGLVPADSVDRLKSYNHNLK